MKKLTITFLSMYISKKGNETFRYKVTGSPDAMAAYQEAKGEYFVVDEATGDVLYFTTRFCGDNATLIVNTDTGAVYADMSEFHKIKSLTDQFGGQFGAEMAKQAVELLLNRRSKTVETPLKKVVDDGKIDG